MNRTTGILGTLLLGSTVLLAGASASSPNLTPRVTALESQVADLQSRVAALEAPTATETPAPTPTPSPTTIQPVTPAPSGVAGWTQIFSDDFDSIVTSRYFFYLSTWGDTRYKAGDRTNGGLYQGSSCLTASGGIAKIRLYRDANNQPRSCAFIPIVAPPEDDQLYGRYEIRFRASAIAAGWKTAWLLWPGSGVWPRDGEIDFPEGNLNSTISAFMHRQDATASNDQDAFPTTARYDAWHVAVIEWKPTSVRFVLDGTTIGTSTSRIPNTPMHWVVQSETALDWSLIPAAAAELEVDYLRVWSLQ